MLKVASFEGTPTVVKFPFDTLNEVVKRTWAENEVFKLNRMIAPHTPPTHVKRGVKSFFAIPPVCYCAINEKRER